MTTISLALTQLARAADGTPPDILAKFQQAALATCNHDLDSGHFDWASVDECVAYKTTRLQEAYRAKPASQAAAGPRAH